jgi:hypothetical protein
MFGKVAKSYVIVLTLKSFLKPQELNRKTGLGVNFVT